MSLVATHLRKSFGDTRALRDLSFTVDAGELYGLVGPDGAGKTTTIRLLAGLLDPDGGAVSVLGRDPRDAREEIGLMPQQYSLYRDLTIGENLRFFSRLYRLPLHVFEQRRKRLLGITRLERFIDRPAGALSGGMYKKLALACALLHEPKALLLDEPSNGVDPVSRRELWALLYEFVDRGMSVIVSTPYMDEAERCSRVGLLHKGELLTEGPIKTLLEQVDGQVFEAARSDEAALASHPAVEAMSPAGTKLRVTVRRGAVLPFDLRPVAPTFEDVFLSKVHNAQH